MSHEVILYASAAGVGAIIGVCFAYRKLIQIVSDRQAFLETFDKNPCGNEIGDQWSADQLANINSSSHQPLELTPWAHSQREASHEYRDKNG